MPFVPTAKYLGVGIRKIYSGTKKYYRLSLCSGIVTLAEKNISL
jgi:hypothetical protein